jgi:hypothetical protein
MSLPTSAVVLAGIALGVAGLGAGQGGSPPADLRLEGDAAKGRKVFEEFRCHACHRVAGLDFPAPVAQPPVPVVLGSREQRARTDAELLVAIVHPSHDIIPKGAAGETRSGRLSRMGDFSEDMTVRQLVDLVAFIRSRLGPAEPGR